MTIAEKCPGCGTPWPIDYECCPMARPTMEREWLSNRGRPRLESPQRILEEPQYRGEVRELGRIR